MRKIVSIALIALFTVSAFAQKERRKQQFTSEQQAVLQTKKMTLALDLSEKQQDQLLEINTRKAEERKQHMEERKTFKERDTKPTSDELFEIKNQRLESMIAHKAEMKKVLNEEQFEIWSQNQKRRAHKMKNKMKRRKMQQVKRRR